MTYLNKIDGKSYFNTKACLPLIQFADSFHSLLKPCLYGNNFGVTFKYVMYNWDMKIHM